MGLEFLQNILEAEGIAVMPEFRRFFVEGGTYFFTVVTARRARLFHLQEARQLLGRTMRSVRKGNHFDTIAIVLLPDHLHCLWALPAGDCDYSMRWQSIKARFTAEWLDVGHHEQMVTHGYVSQRRRGVWQPRFMEHTIRDELDLHNHANYIHYNPVKHGYVRSPRDWPWSSFHRYVSGGDYDLNWGAFEHDIPEVRGIDEDLIE
jgi:putative transposase